MLNVSSEYSVKGRKVTKIVKQIRFEGAWRKLETMDKKFETNSSFHVKQRTTGKVQFLSFRSFLLVLKKFSFWEEAMGYNSMNS